MRDISPGDGKCIHTVLNVIAAACVRMDIEIAVRTGDVHYSCDSDHPHVQLFMNGATMCD